MVLEKSRLGLDGAERASGLYNSEQSQGAETKMRLMFAVFILYFICACFQVELILITITAKMKPNFQVATIIGYYI